MSRPVGWAACQHNGSSSTLTAKKQKSGDKRDPNGYLTSMSFTEVLQELPALTVEQRQLLIRRALELDDPPFSDADEKLVESRLASLRDAPASAVSLDELKARLRKRTGK